MRDYVVVQVSPGGWRLARYLLIEDWWELFGPVFDSPDDAGSACEQLNAELTPAAANPADYREA
jgi:hypothetical protein